MAMPDCVQQLFVIALVRVCSVPYRRDAFTMNMLEIPQGAGSGFLWDDKGKCRAWQPGAAAAPPAAAAAPAGPEAAPQLLAATMATGCQLLLIGS